jgi:hypothetical protein
MVGVGALAETGALACVGAASRAVAGATKGVGADVGGAGSATATAWPAVACGSGTAGFGGDAVAAAATIGA